MVSQLLEAYNREHRKCSRYLINDNFIGQFTNRHYFGLIDIGLDGIRLISNYSPVVGSRYTINLRHGEKLQSFDIVVAHASVCGINHNSSDIFPEDVLFTIGAKIVGMNEIQKKFIINLLEAFYSNR